MDPHASRSTSLPPPPSPSDTATSGGTPARPAGEPADPVLAPPTRLDEIGRLGPYRVLDLLGRGGMGIVYRAEDPRLKRPLAIKTLSPSLAADPRSRARFEREAQAQAKVTHDHIVPIYEVAEAEGVVYIAMPLLDGLTLAAALKLNSRPPLAELIRIGYEVAEGLAAAHAAGLIHRDIKPSNIWLEAPKRRVKILDFGLARSTTAPADPSDPVTATGAVLGTPAYMSPEQTRGRAVDQRSDVFSLGVVLYEMATGQKPFTGASVYDVMEAVVSHHPLAAHAVVPTVPPALSVLIDRLLTKEPAGRPAADAVAEELERIGAALAAPSGVTPAPPSSAVSAAPEPHRVLSRRLWLAGGAGALLFGGFVWLAGAGRGPKAEPQAAPESSTPDDRAAATELIGYADLTLLPDGERPGATVRAQGALPPGRVAIAAIDFGDRALTRRQIDTFLATSANLRALAEVRMEYGQLELSATDVRRLAETPLAGTLQRLDAHVELTPASLTALAKFERLSELTVQVPAPEDALFERLAELKHLKRLRLSRLAATPALTEKGWHAVAKLPLDALALVACQSTASAFRALTAAAADGAPGAQTLEVNSCLQFDDGALLGLDRRPTGVKKLTLLRLGAITDKGLEPLREAVSLKVLTLSQTQVTARGIEALSRDRSDMVIVWEGKTFGPKRE